MAGCPHHPETTATATCSSCKQAFCERCVAYEVDGDVMCVACGERHDERGRAVGTTLVALVAAAYLATLAIAFVVFRGRPFVGGFAAILAIVLGRTLHVNLRLPVVVRHDR